MVLKCERARHGVENPAIPHQVKLIDVKLIDVEFVAPSFN